MNPATPMPYLAHYPLHLQQQITSMLEQNQLVEWLQHRYPSTHDVANDADLREYVMQFKNRYMKKSPPLSKALFDDKLHIVKHALGTHTYASRRHGNRIKSKNELRISSLFKRTPEPFLAMIVVHELAHFKEKEHNKAFYQLCQHMLADYHQIEFDVRVYLTLYELQGNVFTA